MSNVIRIMVSATDICVELLRYVKSNLAAIKALGVRVRIDRIEKGKMSADTEALFRKKGITRMPAMIDPTGKVFIGAQAIYDVLGRNISNVDYGRNHQRRNPLSKRAAGGVSTHEDLDSYMNQLMFDEYDRDGNNAAGGDCDDNVDPTARMADIMARRAGNRGCAEPTGAPPARRRRGRDAPPPPPRRTRNRRRDNVSEESDDEIADDDLEEDMSSQMLSALLAED